MELLVATSGAGQDFGGGAFVRQRIEPGSHERLIGDNRREDPALAEFVCMLGNHYLAFSDCVDTPWRDQSQRTGAGRQAQVGVVGAEQEAVLGARGEHAVGFVDVAGNQIVDEYADIGFVTLQNHAGLTCHGLGRIDAGHDALGGGFFVAGSAIDLAGEEEEGQALGFEGGANLTTRHRIIFDGIARPHQFGVAQGWDGANHLPLHIFGKRGIAALQVHFGAMPPFGFEVELVAFFVCKAHDFVFDRGAIARTDPFDDAAKHGRAV